VFASNLVVLAGHKQGCWCVQLIVGHMDGYLRGTFDTGRFQRTVQIAAQEAGFVVEHCYGTSLEPILVLKRVCRTPKADLFISTGMHGDEPAGPLTILRMLKSDSLPRDMSLTIFPLINPRGMALNRRENAEGLDINRDFKRFQTEEARLQRDWLTANGRRFDLCIHLHEDWEATGYYLYELNPDREQSISPELLAAVAPVMRIDASERIDGHPAVNGLIRPQDSGVRMVGEDLPEALFMLDRYSRHSYTLEAPSNCDLNLRIGAHEAALLASAEALRSHGHWFDI